ncbi:hypothetical protein Plhal703r1_c19g0084761 [Plasmopara halstedii]
MSSLLPKTPTYSMFPFYKLTTQIVKEQRKRKGCVSLFLFRNSMPILRNLQNIAYSNIESFFVAIHKSLININASTVSRWLSGIIPGYVMDRSDHTYTFV